MDSAIFKYGLAIVAVGAALAVRLILHPFIGPEAPFLTFFFAVMVAAWHGGFGPGLLAALLSTMAANYLFIEPVSTFNLRPRDAIALLLFLTEVVGISLLSDALRRSKRQAQSTADELGRVLHSMNDAFVAINREWVYTHVNDKAAQTIGRPPHELLGRNVWTLFPELVDSRVWREMHAAMEAGSPRTFEEFQEPTGRWYENRLSPYEQGLSVFFADITERKRAEEQQRRDHERLTRAQQAVDEAGRRLEVHLTHTPLGVIEWNAEFRITRWAGDTEGIFGWTAEEMLGRQLGTFRWIHEDDQSHVDAMTARLRTEPRVVSRLRTYDQRGAVHYCEWYSSTVLKEGRMESVLSLLLDVTERHRADQAFKALVSSTASAVGEAFFPVFVRELASALEMKVVLLTEVVPGRANRLRTLAMWIGGEPGPQMEYDVAGTPCEVVLREGAASYRAKVRETFPLDPDLEFLGTESYVGQALYNSAGTLLGHVCVLDDKPLRSQSDARSILSIFASRATAELERLQAQAVIRESEERLKIAGDIAGLSPLEWDPQTGRMLCDRQLKDIWGLSPEAPMDQRAFLAAIHPDDRQAVEAGLARAIDGQGEGWFAAEFRVINEHDQVERWVSARGRTRFDQERAVQFLGAALDVTARKHGEEQLRWWTATLERRVEERTKALRESQDRLRAFATELTVTEQRERDRLAGDLHDYLAQLLVLGRLKLGQVRRLGLREEPMTLIRETEEVLKEALTYTRTLVADLSPPALREAGLGAALQWLAQHMERFGLLVHVPSEADGIAELPGDRAVLVFNSIRELLMNVVKHGKAGEARLRIAREQQAVRFIVEDDGCGFDPARMPNVAAKGFGLLSIRERMQALGGRFVLESAPGRGTTAVLVMPLGGEAAETLRVKRNAVNGGAVSGQSSAISSKTDDARMTHYGTRPTIRVLLVDDHAMFRQGLRSLVEGYPLVEVVGEGGNGLDALTLAGALRPDVVVMDINMPLMDGIEATKGLKARHPEIVVIGLSLHLSSEMDQRMREAGASEYLTKESAIEQLYDAMMTALAIPGRH